MAERADRIVAEFSKNAREKLRVAVGEFNGYTLVHLRIWVSSETGKEIPTKAGISLRAELLPQLIAGLTKAKDAIANVPGR